MHIWTEKLLNLNDEYADEVIALSVFESTAYLFKENQYLTEFLGNRSQTLLSDFN